MKDAITVTRIAQLHPKFIQMATNLINDIEGSENLTIRCVQGFRSFAEQDAIYAQGRTINGKFTPGKVVTQAKGGQSYHCYGLAVDIVPLINTGKNLVNWNYDFSKWEKYAVKYGITWGGNFTNKDPDHFENKFGLNWRDMLRMYDLKQFIPGTTFINF